MSIKYYYVYWVSLVFKDGTVRTVRFTARNDLLARKIIEKLPKFETLVSSYVLNRDTYRQVA